MTFANFILLFRIGLGLLIGGLIARLLRKVIRRLIIQLTPMKKRIAPNAFQTQSRIATIVGVFITFGVCLGLNHTLDKAWQKTSLVHMTQLGNKVWSKPKLAWWALPQKAPASQVPPVDTELSTSKQIDPVSVTPSITPATAPQEEFIVSRPLILEEQYFVQLFAVTSLLRAERIKAEIHGAHQCWIAADDHPLSPFKVLLGPFPNAQAASHHRFYQQREGFPRHGLGLRFMPL